MFDVTLPQLGESVSEGTINKWLVKEGDMVAKDQPLVEIGTDKADAELPAPVAGLLAERLVAEGAVVAVKTVLCRIDDTVTTGSGKPAVPPPAPSRPLASP